MAKKATAAAPADKDTAPQVRIQQDTYDRLTEYLAAERRRLRRRVQYLEVATVAVDDYLDRYEKAPDKRRDS